MNPVKSSLRHPTVTLILAAMAVAVGIHAFLHMPRTEDPTITIRTGLVLALYPGATSEQVEKQVTKTLEKHIFKFPEIRKEKTYSTSRPGLVVINVELEEFVKNADVIWAKIRHEMNETSATELPQGVRGPIVNSDFGDTVAMLIAIHGSRYGYRELRDYSDTIQDELRTIRNVGKLAVYGAQNEQIWITSDLERMSQYFADPTRVAQSLQQRNVILNSGHFEADRTKIPMRTTGLFTTEDQIRNVLVDVSRTGQPVYIRDFADVERRYQDPTFVVRYDGEPSLLLSVEMQKGKNIVELGNAIEQVLGRIKVLLPPDVQLDLIANQPQVVEKRTTQLSHEFMLAIGSVILVTIILLPFRVAVIAAFAIPITLCTTLGVMDAIGIALHQVSIAGLIMVLGIVVDDAIVIADNYVDLLDRKVPRAEAAWQCVMEVLVPVFTATVTIVFSFVPLLILTGSVGEFIMALPITVAIALSVSFVVAVMLTPNFCRFFIKKGLHETAGEKPAKGGKKHVSILNLVQDTYKIVIHFFMGHKAAAVVIGVCAVTAGMFLFRFLPQQFFPTAERNQFVIDVWMAQGTRIEATDAVMRHIEHYLAGRKEVVHFACFVGQSAPRFYYNVNPQQPDAAYGQFIVNTNSVKGTPGLVSELRTALAAVAPEAMVIVKELQQGMIMEAPIEIRLSGNDIGELKRLGAAVENFLLAVPYSQFVHQDYYNDSCMVDLNVDDELANRLGITNALISQQVGGAFDGGPVSVFWEGDRPITILLRLEQSARNSFADVRDAYVNSRVTNAKVPLRAVTKLDPEWQTSRIVRRNGVRTLTVRSFVKEGHYASALLNAVQPQLNALKLPPGYRIDYGGERSNQVETLPRMLTALGISLVAIFLTLLLQFRNISETLIVMSSIPLALPGAVLGLIITRNPFGFTAFMGMISLSGIVVRNAIILIDYINEKMREGHPLVQAATEAGERRLRPIFLTTMAAAVGVTPMILSRSSLWSPLASVIAIGLICSMFFTLLVVPVLFVLVKSHIGKPPASLAALVAALAILAASPAFAETKELSLPEAVRMAMEQNTALKITRAKVNENQYKVGTASADYYPQLFNYSWFLGVSNQQLLTIPAGSLGSVPVVGPFPIRDTPINQGSSAYFMSDTILAQPLTQLFKIHEATGVARSDERAAEADARKAEDEVILGVHQLYYGLLTAMKQKDAAEAALTAAQESLRDAEEALKSGNALDVNVIEAKAAVLQYRQSLLTAETQISDLTQEFDELLGIPLETELRLSDVAMSAFRVEDREHYVQTALSHNPELDAAKATVEKARHAVSAAYDEYIPDVSAFAAYTYQEGSPFLANQVGSFGLMVSMNIWDWGKRRGVIGQREAQLTQAEENLQRLRDHISVETDKAYRKLDRARSMMDVAAEALELQKERLRMSTNQLRATTTSYAKHAGVVAAEKKAESDELQARLAYELAWAELNRIAGTFER